MSREEIQKLLGGYATGTLSAAERAELFEAALEDQELFDALAKEEALRDVLQDSSVRQQLIAALGPARVPFWWLRKPAVLAMAGGLAALLIVALVVRHAEHAAPPEAMVADAIAPQPPVAVPQPRAATRKPVEPRALGRNAKRLAPLPIAKAAPAPAPPPVQAVGGLAGIPEVPRQIVQIPTGRSFVAQQQAPMPAMPRAKAANAAAAKPAVDYTLLLKDADGAYSPVPSDTVFHAGDSVRLQVAPMEAGYVYLFQREDAAAGWKLVAGQRVEQGQRYVLPASGGLQSEVPAHRDLLLVLSRVENVDVESRATPTIVIEYR
jgi:hypothetical protein